MLSITTIPIVVGQQDKERQIKVRTMPSLYWQLATCILTCQSIGFELSKFWILEVN
jgi:hypothetical protein